MCMYFFFLLKSRATAVTQITYMLFTLLQHKKMKRTSHQIHPEKKDTYHNLVHIQYIQKVRLYTAAIPLTQQKTFNS